MADLGSIGTLATGEYLIPDAGPNHVAALLPQCVMAGAEYMALATKDTTEGSPAQPSLRMSSRGVWRFRWCVQAGTRTISISCKQAVNLSPRPTLVVKANPGISVNSDVTATAGSSATWLTVGPATITPASDGAVWVELHNNLNWQPDIAPCFWDTETVTVT